MKKENGFTLIELLAVIVILAIIALIATPLILNVIEKARVGAAKSSTLGYMDAVEKQIAINQLDSSKSNINDGVYTVSALTNDYKVTIKGQAPSEGWISISKGIVTGYSVKIGDYVTNYDSTKNEQEEPEKNGTITTPPSTPIEGTGGSETVEYTKEECFQINDNGDGTAAITKYLCGVGSETEIADVVIPKTIGSLTVVEISNIAFKAPQEEGEDLLVENIITSVSIPDSVTRIGVGAFSGNHLTSLEIPNSVTMIDSRAFQDNQLTSITIGNGITSIGDYAFLNSSLTSVKINNVKENVSLGSYAFSWAEGYSNENIEWLG